MHPILPLLFVGGLLAIAYAALSGRKAEARVAPKELPPAQPSCSADEKQFLANVVEAAAKGMANSTIIEKAIQIAQRCGMPSTEQGLRNVLEQQREEAEQRIEAAVPDLIRQPDRPPEPPIDPATGKPLWFMDTRGGMLMAIPNFPVVLVTFEGLQRLVGAKVDGRIGPETTEKFMQMAFERGFERFPDTQAKLAANVTKWSEVLAKGYPPAEVGRRGHVASPLPGVPFLPWIRFATVMKNVGSPKYLGIWRLDPRRLDIAPEDFPDDPREQYRLFASCVRAMYEQIRASKLMRWLGKEGTTMSGLIALVKQAGIKGAASWLAHKDERSRFPNTTDAYRRANGIF
jgi:hypothetical protein